VANLSLRDKATHKYLSGYAEAEVEVSARFAGETARYGHGLVIPCHGEGDGLATTLDTIPRGSKGAVLIILVVNASAQSPSWAHAANAQTLQRIRSDFDERKSLAPNASLHSHPAGALLLIDRATHSLLPPGQGVGLARKIGADLLLSMIAEGQVASPWIHCSDADATFPRDYFDQLDVDPPEKTAAALYRFRHVAGTGPANYEAALQYEMSLRYYILGLRFATSPYAFHSVGSTLALHATAYAHVRGFPRRRAAEDFYLLNKIAKVGRIHTLEGSPILLSSRASSRVPFGTGASVRRLLETPKPALDFYDPRIFDHLRVWQLLLEEVSAASETPGDLRALLRDTHLPAPQIRIETLIRALERIGALDAAQSALRTSSAEMSRRFHQGFDGFRTLKLGHALRDAGFSDVPMREALENAPFISLAGLGTKAPTQQLAKRVEALDYAPRGALDSASEAAWNPRLFPTSTEPR